jgi:uncharacterized membrane protein
MSNKTNQQPVSVFQLFSKSTELVKANFNSFAILYTLPFIVGLLQISSNNSNNRTEEFFATGTFKFGPMLGAAISLSVVIVALYVVVSLMLLVLEFKAAKGKTPSLTEVWQQTAKLGFRLVGLGLLVGLIVVAGFLALIVPGIIFISWYFLSPFVMIDRNLGITESMRVSKELSKDNWLSIWAVIGMAILISIPGSLGIVGWGISFVLTAFFSVAPALRYLELKKLHTAKQK